MAQPRHISLLDLPDALSSKTEIVPNLLERLNLAAPETISIAMTFRSRSGTIESMQLTKLFVPGSDEGADCWVRGQKPNIA